MITTLLILGHIAFGLVGGAVMSRRLNWPALRNPRCHRRNFQNFDWGSQSDCRRYCEKGCWHVDEGPADPVEVTLTTGAALLWPLMLVGAAVYGYYRIARGKDMPRVMRMSDAEIRRLEKEAGL